MKNIEDIQKLTEDLSSGNIIDKEEHERKLSLLKENKSNIDKLQHEVNKIRTRLLNNDNDVFESVVKAIERSYLNESILTINEDIELDKVKKNKNYKTQELSKLNKKEQKLVSKIYQIIQKNLPAEMALDLINKIQEELKHG